MSSEIKQENIAQESAQPGHEKHWEIVANGAKTYEVQTAKKYVDRNIDFIVPSGDITIGELGNEYQLSEDLTESENVTPYSITISPRKVSVNVDSGWVNEASYFIEGDELTTSTVYFPEANLKTTKKEFNVPLTTISKGESNVKEGSDESKYFININDSSTKGAYDFEAFAENTGVITSGTGVIVTSNNVDAKVTNNVRTIKIAEAQIGVATKAQTEALEEEYTEDTTAVVPSEGYLLIKEGYVPNTKISLATLIPDVEGGVEVAGAEHILQGHQAYDQNGKVVTGTIGNTSLETITTGEVAVNAEVTSTGNIFSEEPTDISITASSSASVGDSVVSIDKGYVAAKQSKTVSGDSKETSDTKYLKVSSPSYEIGTDGKVPFGKEITIPSGYVKEEIKLKTSDITDIELFDGSYYTIEEVLQ